MSERIRQQMIDELRTLQRVKFGSRNAVMRCPFHDDNTPSAGINLDVTASTAPLGWFRCWGCKTSVPWNTFAKQVGIKQINNKKKTADDFLDPKRFSSELLGEGVDPSQEWFPEMKKFEFFDFPETMETWRDVSVSFLEKIGARYMFEFKDEIDRGFFYVWFPVLINGELRGYVKAELEKGSRSSYWNAPQGDPGDPQYNWAHKYGLIFFDYALAMMRRKRLKTIVLSEGPRDSIRQLKGGIPATSVLGAANWSDDKRYLLENQGIERVIVFMDGDDAGRQATEVIVDNLKGYFDVKYIALWKKQPGSDPFNCDVRILKKVKASLI